MESNLSEREILLIDMLEVLVSNTQMDEDLRYIIREQDYRNAHELISFFQGKEV